MCCCKSIKNVNLKPFNIGFHCSGVQKITCRILETAEGKLVNQLIDIAFMACWIRSNDHIDIIRFAMFLIARVGAQIYDTGLVHPIDRF